MLKIAVCDDEPDIVDKIEFCIDSYCKENTVRFYVLKFYDGEELINSKQNFDLIFLDIEMKSLDGIKTAQKIREFDMNVLIVYITSYTKYWRNAYDVHAFAFIEKPFQKLDIHKVIKDFLRSKKDYESANINLNTEKCMLVQNTNEIYYFLVDSKKKIIMYTLHGEHIVKENLSDIYSKLDKSSFYESHRSCILNLKYVAHLKDFEIIMTNDEFVPLAQRKKKEFMDRIHRYLQDK